MTYLCVSPGHHCARCGATDRALVCEPCAREEAGRLHQLVCNARELIAPERAPEWEAEAFAEAMRCDERIDGLVCELNEARARMRLTPEERETVEAVRRLIGTWADGYMGDMLAIIDRLAPSRSDDGDFDL